MEPVTDRLDRARRHVVEGRRIVVSQFALVEQLKSSGRDTREAERTLDLFQSSLAIFEDDLRALQARSFISASPRAEPAKPAL